MNVTVEVTIAQGSNTLTVNTTDAQAAFLGDVPSAVETMTGEWGQPNGREHASPGKLTLTLILDTAEHAAIDYESQVDVTLALDGGDPYPFWRGWIDEITITRRTVHHPDTRQPVTTWVYDLTVGDVIARAAATKINLPILDRQRPAERVDAIIAASPVPLLAGSWTYSAFPSVWLRPRDFDNQPVLTLLHEIASTAMLQVHEHRNGLRIYNAMPGTSALNWLRIRSEDYINPIFGGWTPRGFMQGEITSGARLGGQDPSISTVDASAVFETPRRLNRATMLNEVSVGYWIATRDYEFIGNKFIQGEPEERTVYVRNTSRQASTSQQRIVTDECLFYESDGPEPAPPDMSIPRSWLDQSARPLRTIDTVDLITDRLDTTTVQAITEIGGGSPRNAGRTPRGLMIYNAPDDLDEGWRIVHGTATIRQGEISLTLGVEPASLTGQTTLRFSDIPRPQPYTFPDGETVTVSPQFKYVTTSGSMSFAALALVSNVNHHLYRVID